MIANGSVRETTKRTAFRKTRGLLAFVLVMLAIAGCSQRVGVSWAELTVVGEHQDVLVSYRNEMALVSRVNGFLVTEDLEGTSSNRDASGLWLLRGNDTGSEFFTMPISLGETSDGDRLFLAADYNNKLLIVNFDRTCFASLTGTCFVNEDPFSVELPGHVVANIAEDAETFYIPLSEHDVIAVRKGIFADDWDREDDQERRRRTDETFSTAWTFETERGIWAEPLVLGDRVYIASTDHHLFQVNAETGEEIEQLDLGGALGHKPVIYDGTDATDFADDVAAPVDPDYDLDTARLYVGTFGRRIYEVPLDFQTGDEDGLTFYGTSDWVWGAPKIVDGILYAADLGGQVYALDVNNGLSEIWRTSTNIGGIRASPLVTEDFVIVASRDGTVMWLRRDDGSEFTQQEVGGEVLSDLLLLPGDEEASTETLVIASTVNNSRLMVAFTIDGAPRWTYPAS